MPKRDKILQVIVSDDEFKTIQAVCKRFMLPISRQARSLLMTWCAAVTEEPGALRGGICGSKVCDRPDLPAMWWNRNSKGFYCEPCAKRINAQFGDLCSPAVPEFADTTAYAVTRTVRGASDRGLFEKILRVMKEHDPEGFKDTGTTLFDSVAVSTSPEHGGS